MENKIFNADELIQMAKEYYEAAVKDAEINPYSDQIQVVIVEPNKKPYKKVIENNLETMQAIVGGYIENINVETNNGRLIGIVVNEEGKLIGLPYNRCLVNYDHLVGTFFITAYNMQGDNISLNDQETDYYIRRFTATEIYL